MWKRVRVPIGSGILSPCAMFNCMWCTVEPRLSGPRLSLFLDYPDFSLVPIWLWLFISHDQSFLKQQHWKVQSNARVFCSQRAKAALALVVRRGTLGFLRFWQFFRSVFRFLFQKTSVFRFWCSFRFADFSFFSIRFSVFVENNSGFSVLLSNVVFGFSYFESKWGFRFWPNFLAVLDDSFFGFAVSNIIYPNAPLRK